METIKKEFESIDEAFTLHQDYTNFIFLLCFASGYMYVNFSSAELVAHDAFSSRNFYAYKSTGVIKAQTCKTTKNVWCHQKLKYRLKWKYFHQKP